MDSSAANSLAWIFFGTTTFVVLSLVYEFCRWGFGVLFKEATPAAGSENE